MTNLYCTLECTFCGILLLILVACSEDAPTSSGVDSGENGSGSSSTYQLKVDLTPSNAGSVSPSSGTFDSGENVELTAISEEGFRFVEWLGDQSGSTNPLSFEMDENHTVTARFERKEYPLSIAVDGEGAVYERVIETLSETSYKHGTTVELTASAAQGWSFSHWEGDLDGEKSEIRVTIDQKVEVTAVFTKALFPLDIHIVGNGSVEQRVIESLSATEYESGSTVELIAIPDDEWRLVNWKGDLESQEDTVRVKIEKETDIIVVFEKPIVHNVNMLIDGEGEVNLAVLEGGEFGSGYEEGTRLRVVAKPADGWIFVEWKGLWSGMENPMTITVNQQIGLHAVFSNAGLDHDLLGQQFAQAQFHGVRGNAGGGGLQIGKSLFADLYAQYFATTAENFDSDRNVPVANWLNSAWNYPYGTPGPQIQGIIDFTEEKNLPVLNAISKIWKAYVFHTTTDYWGPIIYTQFGNGEISVAYDSQQEVYNAMFADITEGIDVLEDNLSATPFVGHDLIYDGNATQWVKFANSLRLRLAMRIVYADESLARTHAEAAISHPIGVIEENADNALVATGTNSRNPMNTITNWGEFRMSATMESFLNGYEDPRADRMFNEPTDPNYSGYRGLRNGLTRPEKGVTINSLYSDMNDRWLPANSGGYPGIEVMRAAEVWFLRAEGSLRGWNMGISSAQIAYETGIRADMEDSEYGAVDPADINDYISSTATPTDYTNADQPNWDIEAMTNIPVAWDTGGIFERNLEQIITQKWIALYPDGMEAWAEARRTGYPQMFPRIESGNPNVAADEMMRRVPFVDNEYSNNAAAVEAAVGLLGGPDNAATKLWWDKK